MVGFAGTSTDSVALASPNVIESLVVVALIAARLIDPPSSTG